MVYTSIYKGIIFVEGNEPSAKTLGAVEYKHFLSYNSQLKSLDSVKDQLVERTLALGGNAVLNFTYGQKSFGWFKAALCSLDDNIQWYGSGVAAIIPPARINEIMQKLNNP